MKRYSLLGGLQSLYRTVRNLCARILLLLRIELFHILKEAKREEEKRRVEKELLVKVTFCFNINNSFWKSIQLLKDFYLPLFFLYDYFLFSVFLGIFEAQLFSNIHVWIFVIRCVSYTTCFMASEKLSTHKSTIAAKLYFIDVYRFSKWFPHSICLLVLTWAFHSS